jgi:predicted kinase
MRAGVREQTALLRANVERVAEEMADEERAAPGGRPCLVVLVGLPAAGKSHFARALAARVGGVAVATDALRRRLFIAPSYAQAESHAVFALARAVARRLLARGHVVIVDATNLRERDRRPLYSLARDTALVIVRVVAPETLIRERLGTRAARVSAADASEADWAVYLTMRERYEEPSRPYLTVDTSGDLDAEVGRIEEAIRLASA